MSSVMMDRWGLDCAFAVLAGETKQNHKDYYPLEPSTWVGLLSSSGPLKRAPKKVMQMAENQPIYQCWDNFLTAIVLWDEIWSCNLSPYEWEDILPNAQNEVNDLNNIMHQVDVFLLDHELFLIYNELNEGPTGNPHSFTEHYTRSMTLSRRTESYQILSSSLSIPYLAHPYRAQMKSRYQPIFNRRDMVRMVDRELEEYYSEINNQLGRNLYQFKYPVLIDLITGGATSPKEELQSALTLRKNPDIVSFRDSMCEIEHLVQRGDTQLLQAELKLVSDLAKEITTKYKRELTLGEISLFPTPSFTFPIHLKKTNKGEPHVTFIRQLLNYGVYKRPLSFFN